MGIEASEDEAGRPAGELVGHLLGQAEAPALAREPVDERNDLARAANAFADQSSASLRSLIDGGVY